MNMASTKELQLDAGKIEVLEAHAVPGIQL